MSSLFSDALQYVYEHKLFFSLLGAFFLFRKYQQIQMRKVADTPIEGSKVKKIKSVESWDAGMEAAKMKGTVVVVDFYATWCPPCIAATPIYAKLSKEYCEDESKCQFWKVDVDECSPLAQRGAVRSMPTFQIYKGGAQVDQMVGFSEAKLVSMLKKHL